MEAIFGALLIFILRITDVSLGTLRVIHVVRGQRFRAAGLGFIEASVFLFAITQVFQQLDNLVNMFAYAAGFAAGTILGVTLENWIASGWVLARIISREKADELLATLRASDFGVTALRGAGKDGDLLILFVVSPRRRGRQLLELTQSIDPKAFITVDPVSRPVGGYITHVATPPSVRK